MREKTQNSSLFPQNLRNAALIQKLPRRYTSGGQRHPPKFSISM